MTGRPGEEDHDEDNPDADFFGSDADEDHEIEGAFDPEKHDENWVPSAFLQMGLQTQAELEAELEEAAAAAESADDDDDSDGKDDDKEAGLCDETKDKDCADSSGVIILGVRYEKRILLVCLGMREGGRGTRWGGEVGRGGGEGRSWGDGEVKKEGGVGGRRSREE